MVGCAKRDAQKAQTIAQAAKDEASSAQAPGYAPTAFNEASRLFNQAQQQFDAGSYKESIEQYQQAEARFRSAKEAAIEKKPVIDAIVAKIEEALGKATANMEKARTGGALPAEELTPVQTIVDGLSQRMESEIRVELDEEKLNAFLAEVEQGVVRTDSLALAHLKPQAATAKQEIQTLITRAQELKADVHAPDQFGQVMEKFKAVESAEGEGQWQKVIDLTGEMKEPLNQVIQASQVKAAGDILLQTSAQITQAKQLNVQGVDAFTAAVQRAEAAIQTGQTALQSQDYSGAINASDQAKAALKEAYQSLGQLAQTKIDESKANLQKAIDQEAEKYAASVVAQVKEAIAGAEELLKAENYSKAYSAAQAAQKASSQAVDAGRRGKAQIALDAVEQPFSVLHGQGGAQYAADAYKQTLAQVQDLRDKMKNGEYEAVVAAVTDVVKVVDSAVGALAESTSKYIDKTDEALNEAKTANAPEWVGVQYANAVNLKAAAEKDQKSKKFLASIRNAEASIKVAKDAEAKAYRLQTDQNIRKSDEYLVTAKRAEQDRLSPLAYRKAIESRDESVRLLDQGEAKNAYQNSLDMVKKAERALNNLVMTAKEKTDSALAAESMKYSEPEMNQSLSYLNKAEEAQKAQNFTVANEMAIESAKLADKAEYFTWKQRSVRLLFDLEGTKEELEFHLAPVKTPALYEQALSNLAEAKVQQIDQDYKASYDYAAKADAAKNAAWDSMKAELEKTILDLKQVADWMGQNAKDVKGREIKVSLLDTIPELEANIALRDWKAAYASADKCLKVSESARARFEQRNRSLLSKELQQSINPYEKQLVLGVIPEKKEQFRDTLASLQKPGEEQTYEDVYKQYENASKEVIDLPTTIVTQAKQHTEEFASMLQEADVAGANKYYKDWYRDLSSDLQLLRNAVRGENFTEIASFTRKLEHEAPRLLSAVRLAASEDEYFSELEKNLNQMNNVLQDFGFLGSLPKKMILAARLTEYKVDEVTDDMFRALQGNMSVRTLLVNAELLEDNVANLKPPKTLETIHKKAVKSFKLFRAAAEGFVVYGETGAHDIYYREEALSNGYDKLHGSLKINQDLLYEMKEARKLTGMDKFLRGFKKVEKQFGEFYFNYGE